MIALLKRSLELKPSRRFEDGGQMLAAYLRAKPKVLRHCDAAPRRRKDQAAPRSGIGKKSGSSSFCGNSAGSWKRTSNAAAATGRSPNTCRPARGAALAAKCCATKRRFPPAARAAIAARSSIGTTAPGATAPASKMFRTRSTPTGATWPAAATPKCDRKDLMPFMRYCPWCHTKVRQAWKIAGSTDTCRKCGWGVAARFLDALPVVRRQGSRSAIIRRPVLNAAQSDCLRYRARPREIHAARWDVCLGHGAAVRHDFADCVADASVHV